MQLCRKLLIGTERGVFSGARATFYAHTEYMRMTDDPDKGGMLYIQYAGEVSRFRRGDFIINAKLIMYIMKYAIFGERFIYTL